MKVSSFFATALSLLALSASTAAQITLGPFPPMVVAGETYTLNWTATANFTYTLWLIEEENGNPYDWHEVANLTNGLHFPSLDGSYTWTVPSNLSASGVYAVWIFAAVIPAGHEEADGQEVNTQTNWFTITSTSSPSTTSSAPMPTLTPSATTTLVPTSGAPRKSSNKSLSGGAIAGIVIGIILAIAIAVGVVVFLRWRKKRSAAQGREAEARANRLAPVMQEGSASYEMSGRMP